MQDQNAEGLQPEPPKTSKRSRQQKVLNNTQDLIPVSKATKKATKANIDSIKQRVYFDHAEPMLQETFLALRKLIRRGDPQAIKLSAEMNQLVAKAGPAIVAQFNNRNETRVESAPDSQTASSLDALIRRLDKRDSKLTSAQEFIDV